MAFYSWNEIVKDSMRTIASAGMSRQSIVGIGDALHARGFPNLKCAPHQHEAEQFSIVLKGRMRFVIGEETRVLGLGGGAHSAMSRIRSRS